MHARPSTPWAMLLGPRLLLNNTNSRVSKELLPPLLRSSAVTHYQPYLAAVCALLFIPFEPRAATSDERCAASEARELIWCLRLCTELRPRTVRNTSGDGL